MPSAHPLSPVGDLGAPPLGVALCGVLAVAAVLVLPGTVRRGRTPAAGEEREPGRWAVVTRTLSVALLAAIVWTGRLGDPGEVDNVVPALVLGVLWPVLLLAALLLGAAFWRAVDPWDAIVRAVERVAPGSPSARLPVYAALPAAIGWTVVLDGYVVGSRSPRAIGALLAAYTVLVVAVGIAAGRQAMRHVEVFGLAAGWAGRWRHGGLATWRPPPGAEAVAGALLGGMAFMELRISPWWGRIPVSDWRWRITLAGAIGTALLGAAVATGLERWARRRGAPGSVAAVLVPMLPAYALATQLRRFLISVQLVRRLTVDPGAPVNDEVLSIAQLRWTCAAVLVAGGVLGALVLRRRVSGRSAQDPAAAALYLAVGAGILGVTTTI